MPGWYVLSGLYRFANPLPSTQLGAIGEKLLVNVARADLRYSGCAVINTVPRRLTEELLAFCRSLSPERPVFVRSKPSSDAQRSACFDNVQRKVERAGGSVAYGWAIWNLPGAYFEAEHHGVWCDRHGRLMDVSPQPAGFQKILFLPDPAAVYDPQTFRSNVIAAESGNDAAAAFVELARARYAILDTYRAKGARVAWLSPADQAMLTRIEGQLQALWPLLSRGVAGT